MEGYEPARSLGEGSVSNCLVEFRWNIEGRVWHRQCVIQAQVARLSIQDLLDTESVTSLISETYVRLKASDPKLALLTFGMPQCIRERITVAGLPSCSY